MECEFQNFSLKTEDLIKTLEKLKNYLNLVI